MKLVKSALVAIGMAVCGFVLVPVSASALPATAAIAGVEGHVGTADSPAVENVQYGCVFPFPCVGPRYYGRGYYYGGGYYRRGPYYGRGYYYRGGHRYYRR